jgi:hypothetical protein
MAILQTAVAMPTRVRSDSAPNPRLFTAAFYEDAVFREIARVLKLGGRLAVSDFALKRELPPEIGDDLMAYTGCIAWAVLNRSLVGRFESREIVLLLVLGVSY